MASLTTSEGMSRSSPTGRRLGQAKDKHGQGWIRGSEVPAAKMGEWMRRGTVVGRWRRWMRVLVGFENLNQLGLVYR